jgi:hypothetical protein
VIEQVVEHLMFGQQRFGDFHGDKMSDIMTG